MRTSDLDGLSIDVQQSLHPSQDFQLLREQGMNYIRQLSGSIWTDHNLHDPGITTLEILCYAITDLGYRTSFPIEDLMTGQDGFNTDPALTSFFPAQEALTNTALTQLDYRKLLLKIDGIRNAWMLPRTTAPGSEIPVFVDKKARSLSLNDKNSLGQDNLPLFINGLYDVRLELVPHNEWGSLNETALTVALRKGDFSGYDGSVSLLENKASHRQSWAAVAEANDDAADLMASLSVVISEPGASAVKVQCEFNAAVLPELRLELGDDADFTEAQWLDLLQSPTDSPLLSFARKQARIEFLLGKATCALMDSRNLCEDYASIDTVSSDYIAICSDIEVSPEADLEEVQAHVYFAIEQYMNPNVPAYSLKELLDNTIDPDEIFNGPYINSSLQHQGQPVFDKPGFHLHEDLNKAELRKIIHSSDIINVLMDIEHVINVKSLLLRKYSVEGEPLGDAQAWCLSVQPGHQPVLSIQHSNILFLKRNVPFIARPGEFQATLNHLRAVANKSAYGDPQESLVVPHGKVRDTLTHYPVQHDFPLTYQIGQAGLEANADIARIQQAQQFKGYLTIFEQVLADYLAQLAHLPVLFSLDKELSHSYFSQYLTDIAGSLQHADFADEFYVNAGVFADEAERSRLRESHEAFQDRRHRLLDHLLARFAEKFTDYVMLMLRSDGQSLLTSSELINDKIDFLRQQPVLSRERNRAFNYKPKSAAEVWDTDNVSGVEKRSLRLAGVDDFSRRNLACAVFMASLMDTKRLRDGYRIEIKDSTNKLLFKSFELFPSREEAIMNAGNLFGGIQADASFALEITGDGDHIWRLTHDATSLMQDKTFNNLTDAQADIDKVRARIEEIFSTSSSSEGESDDAESVDTLFDTREFGREFGVEIQDSQQLTLFKAKESFETRAQAQVAATAVFPGVKDPANYVIDESGGVEAINFRLEFNGVTLTQDASYDNVNEAHHAIGAIVARYFELLLSHVCNDEGLYLIEHVLLRPRDNNSDLFDICVGDTGTACSDEDPYSFRASVIMPYWPQRFQQLTFRTFFENLMREQTPAHIQLKICWIDHLQMQDFETALKNWLLALHSETFDSSELVDRQNALLTVLQQLRSVYPTAELHDCDDDNGGEPVRLGSTNLGVF